MVLWCQSQGWVAVFPSFKYYYWNGFHDKKNKNNAILTRFATVFILIVMSVKSCLRSRFASFVKWMTLKLSNHQFKVNICFNNKRHEQGTVVVNCLCHVEEIYSIIHFLGTWCCSRLFYKLELRYFPDKGISFMEIAYFWVFVWIFYLELFLGWILGMFEVRKHYVKQSELTFFLGLVIFFQRRERRFLRGAG